MFLTHSFNLKSSSFAFPNHFVFPFGTDLKKKTRKFSNRIVSAWILLVLEVKSSLKNLKQLKKGGPQCSGLHYCTFFFRFCSDLNPSHYESDVCDG